MEHYINTIFSKSKGICPDITKDFERFSRLHSWYKHLDNCTLFYIVLLPGEEWRYDFDKRLTDSDQTNLHWHFWQDYKYEFYKKHMDDIPLITQELLQFIKQFQTYFNRELSDYTMNPQSLMSLFQLEIATSATKLYWDNFLVHTKKYQINTFIQGFYDNNSYISTLPMELIHYIITSYLL